MVLSFFSAFGAGVLSSLSPCVYPMIPITLGYLGVQNNNEKKYQKIILFFVGQVLAFTAIGLLAVRLGDTFGFTSEDSLVQKIIGGILILFGIVSLFNYLPSFMLKLNSNSFSSRVSKDQVLFPLIIGMSSALMASPCSSPILGSVLATLAGEGSYLVGIVMMLAYSVGASCLFLILGLGLWRLQSLPRAGNWMNHIHRLSSVIMIIAGLYYLYQ